MSDFINQDRGYGDVQPQLRAGPRHGGSRNDHGIRFRCTRHGPVRHFQRQKQRDLRVAACTRSVRRIAVSLALVVAISCSSGSSNNGPPGSGGGGGSTATGGTSGATGGTTGAGGAATDGGASGGAPGTGGAGADGGAGAGAPIILSLAINVTALTPSGALIVTAVVTHPQGIAQVIGGALNDPSGASYGAFMVSTISGSYSVTLSWDAIEAVQDINAN